MKLDTQLLERMTTNTGENIRELSESKPVLLIFLRHFGCTFCREALDELSKKQEEIRGRGVQMVFVHMSDNETAEKYFDRYRYTDSVFISDPECSFYQRFGLVKGDFNQLFGLQVWMRGLEAGVLKGNGLGTFIGDGFQMPGVFMIWKGEVKESFIHKYASDRPDYQKLADCCAL